MIKSKIIFIILILFTFRFFSQQKIKILITDFMNINQNSEYNYIINAIGDALKANLFTIEEFSPYLLEEIKDSKKIIKDYEGLLKYALTEKIDIIIKGYFYIDKEKELIRINFFVIDVLTGRLKISYEETGETGIEIFSIIKKSSKILAEKMSVEIKAYPQEFIEKRRKSLLRNKEVEFLIILNGNFFYSLLSFIIENKNEKIVIFNDNKIFHSISTIIDTRFYFELPNKKDYLGFNFYIFIPIIGERYLFNNIEVELGFSYSFRKMHFFTLGFNFYNFNVLFRESIDLGTFNSYIYFEEIISLYLGFGLKYGFHINKNHILETGILVFPPNSENNTVKKIMTLNKPNIRCSDNNYILNNSLISPLIFFISYSFYIGNIGINILNRFSLNYIEFYVPPNNFNLLNDNYGIYWAPFLSFSVGISFKDNYIIRIE